MMSLRLVCLVPLLAGVSSLAVPSPLAPSWLSPLVRLGTASSVVEHGMANVHLQWADPGWTLEDQKTLRVTYGPCDSLQADGDHVLVASSQGPMRRGEAPPTRAVWFVEEDSREQGCLSAWIGDELAARSGLLTIVQNEQQAKRRARDLAKRSDNEPKMSNFDTTGLCVDTVDNPGLSSARLTDRH